VDARPPDTLLFRHPGHFDVIVVGGGHAGGEAALASARSGCLTLLLTHNVDRIGWMSCNPAIGGVGKSQLVAEIDALGGEMARNADRAGTHYKLLNSSRGPAVQAMRVQCDKLAYATAARRVLEGQPNLLIKQGNVTALWLEDGLLRGVATSNGLRFSSKTVVLTAGTFLEAICHTGDARESGGRAGDGASLGLGDQLRALGVRTMRHKTGTCPRLDGRTLDESRLRVDPGLKAPKPLSRGGLPPVLEQMDCLAAATTAETHRIIRENLHRSPLYGGVIEGVGPRYCPSIEDKVVRFAHHDRHLLFLEREGWQTDEVYVNGLSTSLPADVQVDMVRSIPGLERAEIVRFGYAVEYDAIDARQLDRTLELPVLPGLFFAGQVNGSSGYEEAAAQGLVAGLNAVARVRSQPPVVFDRTESYLGVLVDDLVTQGADEPYRMFTARAEHRLTLRTSNADMRLTPLGRRLGLVDDAQWGRFEARKERLALARQVFADVALRPTVDTRAVLGKWEHDLTMPMSLESLIKRPDLPWQAVLPWLPEDLLPGGAHALDDDDADELQVALRYQGYIARDNSRRQRAQRAEHLSIPEDLDFAVVGGLTSEAVQKLQRVRPATLGQVTRIPGLTPATVQALAVHLARRRRAARLAGGAVPDVSEP
jgi:tRNA uridine 5-carboxymethylaminomethyl modification enzyme